MNICAARDQGPSSAGMARHLAPFSWRQRMAEMVRRRSFGCVLPLGRHASTNGSKFVHCASDTIALSSFQKEQNARHHKQFKREQALGGTGTPSANAWARLGASAVIAWNCVRGMVAQKQKPAAKIAHDDLDRCSRGPDVASM